MTCSTRSSYLFYPICCKVKSHAITMCEKVILCNTSFSPNIPSLLFMLLGLNMLQSGLHKQHMKDLFVELCLTVPVRLSSLLPYLPMLMDPLVSALNGSQTLVSQGLRTLELCVDNLQPDFLYDHIQPVRAELMQVGGGSHHDQWLHCPIKFFLSWWQDSFTSLYTLFTFIY